MPRHVRGPRGSCRTSRTRPPRRKRWSGDWTAPDVRPGRPGCPPPLTTPLLRPAELLGTGERPLRLLPVPQLVPRHAEVVLQYSRLSEAGHPLLERLDRRSLLPVRDLCVAGLLGDCHLRGADLD